MDAQHYLALKLARSMEVFADGEPTFSYSAWREWSLACAKEGRMIPQAEFKARRVRDDLDTV